MPEDDAGRLPLTSEQDERCDDPDDWHDCCDDPSREDEDED